MCCYYPHPTDSFFCFQTFLFGGKYVIFLLCRLYTEFNDNELEPQNISHGNLTKLAALDHSLTVQIFLSGGILNGWFPSPLWNMWICISKYSFLKTWNTFEAYKVSFLLIKKMNLRLFILFCFLIILLGCLIFFFGFRRICPENTRNNKKVNATHTQVFFTQIFRKELN